ncbi:uncharacterized protein LOC131691335 [Topomyia yanbarensis]|uniref:uncharacterized protein LOC131691335 n=1 Tax=Topomyia yanbarensis TaxID=2498891 RepID=UPI00273BD13D|nr:uncharacterized protein LOC131691335 [Topomyia yanbarensis]
MYSCIGLANNVQSQRQTVQQKFSTLPPNVNGRQRGTLEIRLPVGSCIRWKSAKSYPAVDIQLLWWGQQEVSRLHWEQGNTRSDLRASYDILTSEELFRKYLRAAEPIQVRLASSRTNSLIGTALVPVPEKIVNFRAGGCGQIEATSKGEINSKSGFGLGEICMDFYLKFDEIARRRDNKENKKIMVQDCKKELPLVVPERDVDLMIQGDSVHLHQGKPPKQIKTFRSLGSDSRDKVLNYLLGKAVSGSEDDALSEICTISPTESLMDALNRFDTAPEQKKAEYLKTIDSVRLSVESLKFTKAGLKEVFHKSKMISLADIGFLIKVKIPSQSSSVPKIKFSSALVSDCGEAVFNGKATTKIVWPQKYDDYQFDFLVYLTLGPVFHQRSTTGKLIFLGSAVVKLDELLNNRFACYKKCPVRLVADDILLGMLTIRLELGARGLHFGSDLIDAVLVDKENISISSSSSESDIREPCWSFKPSLNRCHDLLPIQSHFQYRPISCTQDESRSGKSASKSFLQNQAMPNHQSAGSKELSHSKENSSPDQGPRAMDTQEDTQEQTGKLLHGVLHLGQLKDTSPLSTGGYFLIAHGFWSDEGSPVLTTELCQNQKTFNYLITFPVLPNARFLERTKNQHMLVELWQKSPGAAEKLVGVTRLPLHQFYIAFRDAQLAEHLARAKLPVISIDGWSGIGSPLASDPCGQVQVVLAIGTENQIEYFKLSRGLKHTSGDAPVTGNMPTVPGGQLQGIPSAQKSSSSTQTNAPPPENMVTPSTALSQRRGQENYHPVNTISTGKQQSEVANMLSAFIENLAQRMPISSERSTAPCYDQNFAEQRNAPSRHSQANDPQLRQTSDLLENLQRALTEQASSTTVPGKPAGSAAPMVQVQREKLFKVCVEIEQAVNLPKMSVSKKYGKRNKNRNSGTCGASGGNQRTEVEPSAYVTFEGYNLQPGTANTVKSHEGIVYTTAVVENCSNPTWQKKFEVSLPADLMINDEKRFILKVWRKAVNNNDLAKCRMVPAPMEDAVIGFTAVDLCVLLKGMPCILGWYNIRDFSGRCNGQIKINITPLENVTTLCQSSNENVNFQIPLSIDVECAGIDAGNISLSRALKRKFTELEEITQRLKARLFDVTGDENDDPDEEFERDLNTEADEADDDGWVDPAEDTSGQKRNSQFPNGALTMTTNTSSYSMSSERKIPERSLTGCSDRSSRQSTRAVAIDQLELEKLLKKHDLDTLINPNILKNLLNPSIMSTSESTPMSNPYENIPESGSPAGTSDDADMSEGSTEAGGSIASDKVKLISSALQRTTISDVCEPATRATTASSGSGQCDTTEQQHQREAPEGEPMKVNDK